MLFGPNKYLNLFFQKNISTVVLLVLLTVTARSQDRLVQKDTVSRLNPLLYTSFKKQAKPNPFLTAYIKPRKHELLYWPNYPLTAAQLEARNREWERRNNQSIGRQIANDIIESYVNSLIYGKKHTPVVVPKF